MTVYILISENARELFGDQEMVLLDEALDKSGINYEYIVWQKLLEILTKDEKVCEEFMKKNKDDSIFVIKGVWDYQNHLEKFDQLFKVLKEKKLKVFNNIDALQWNMIKGTYLKDLEKEGVKIIPTTVIDYKNDLTKLTKDDELWNSIFDSYKKYSDEVLIKPSFGAGGWLTKRFKKNEKEKALELCKKISVLSNGILIQPFIHAIHKNGERLMFFIDETFSHMIKKDIPIYDYVSTNAKFNLQAEKDVEKKYVDYARNVMTQTKKITGQEHFLHGRVDVLQHGDEILLLELELIEPCLHPTGNDVYKLFINKIKEIM